MKIRPCPFCGGEIERHSTPGVAGITYALCGGCGLVASFRPHLKGDAMIAQWNRREACNCECHAGAIGFFHCFGPCCDKPQ